MEIVLILCLTVMAAVFFTLAIFHKTSGRPHTQWGKWHIEVERQKQECYFCRDPATRVYLVSTICKINEPWSKGQYTNTKRTVCDTCAECFQFAQVETN